MLEKIKKRWREWRAKWTVDHSVDVAVDLVLLLIDIIASPVLIVARLLRYVIGDYVVNKIKSGLKIAIHWWEKRSRPVRSLLLVLFLIIAICIDNSVFLYGNCQHVF